MSRGAPTVKVSVAMITYNHEAYIAQALDSILMQRCDFDFECVVGDDGSTDATPAIVEEYSRRYPDRIRPVLREHNLGGQRNLADVLERCTGQYVAYLEGDDFWTSADKLQKQVDFMDLHLECAMCFHDAGMLFDDGRQSDAPGLGEQERFELEDLFIQGNFIAACTVMYRWGLMDALPPWWDDVWIADLALHALHAQHGWIGYISESMATYRIHDSGMWSGESLQARIDGFAKVLRLLDESLGFEFHDTIERTLFSNEFHLAVALQESGSHALAAPYVKRCLRHLRYRGELRARPLAMLGLNQAAPGLVRLLRALKGRSVSK